MMIIIIKIISSKIHNYNNNNLLNKLSKFKKINKKFNNNRYLNKGIQFNNKKPIKIIKLIYLRKIKNFLL